jgi:biotin carboxyl carrier protein
MKQFKVTVNGQSYDVAVEEVSAGNSSAVRAPSAPVATLAPVQPAAAPAPAVAPIAAGSASAGSTSIKAPMPGTVMSFKVTVGQSVQKGDVLLILEAMKMENEIVATQGGKVSALRVPVGASVNTNDPLVDLE